MLTKESHELIQSFLGNSDIKSLLKNQQLQLLFDTLKQQSYTNSFVKVHHGIKLFPQSYFLAKSLSSKLSEEKDTLTLKWTTTNSYNHSITCELNIYLQDRDKPFPNTKLLVKALSLLFALTDKNRKFTIHLALLNDRKLIRKNQKHITKKNVNSGSCSFSDTEAEICVWRKEEAIKVLFHECIHALRFSDLNSDDDITQKLCQKYNLESKAILIDESYTEIWAKILNCYLVSYLVNAKDMYQHFCTMLAIEKEFSLYQANKVRMIAKRLKTKNKYSNLDSDTNVTAYFIVVAEIFDHFNEFLTICGTNPYLKEIHKCKQFLLTTNTVKKRKVKQSDKFYNTMRMSVIELKL